MALIYDNSNDKTGISVDDAYLRIRSVSVLNPANGGTEIAYDVFESQTARDNDKAPFASYKAVASGADGDTYFGEDVLDDAGKTVLKQAYAYLKSLSEFSGATDA